MALSDFDKLLLSQYADGEVPDEEVEEIGRWIDRDDEAAAFFAELMRGRVALRANRDEVLGMMAEADAGFASDGAHSHRSRLTLFAWVALAAACLTLLVGGGLVVLQRVAPTEPDGGLARSNVREPASSVPEEINRKQPGPEEGGAKTPGVRAVPRRGDPSPRRDRARSKLARIEESEGALRLVRGEETRAVAVDEELKPGDRLQTSETGTARIGFAEGAHAWLGPKSDVVLASYPGKAEDLPGRLRLLSGALRLRIADGRNVRGWSVKVPDCARLLKATAPKTDFHVYVGAAVREKKQDVDLKPMVVHVLSGLLQADNGREVETYGGRQSFRWLCRVKPTQVDQVVAETVTLAFPDETGDQAAVRFSVNPGQARVITRLFGSSRDKRLSEAEKLVVSHLKKQAMVLRADPASMRRAYRSFQAFAGSGMGATIWMSNVEPTSRFEIQKRELGKEENGASGEVRKRQVYVIRPRVGRAGTERPDGADSITTVTICGSVNSVLLEQASGSKVSVDPALIGRPFTVTVNGRAPRKVLQAIADSLGCRFVEDEQKRFYLKP